MDISPFKTWRTCFPYFGLWMKSFNRTPYLKTNSFCLNTVFYIKQIKVIVLSIFIDYNNRTANYFSVNNCFIYNRTISFERTVNIFFRKNNLLSSRF